LHCPDFRPLITSASGVRARATMENNKPYFKNKYNIIILYLLIHYADHDIKKINIKLIHTYIPLMLYPVRGIRSILDIPPRHPRFTKMRLNTCHFCSPHG
jgi:hypothetical protein